MYKAHLKGTGEGCDYTIGCNHALIDINTTSMDEAVDKVNQLLDPTDNTEYCYNIDEIESVTIFEVSEVFILNVQENRNIIHEKLRQERENEDNKADKAEYERLKQKFNE